MTITSYPAQRGRDVRDRAEFDPAALAAETFPPAAEESPAITVLALRSDGTVEVCRLPGHPRARLHALTTFTGAPTAIGDATAEAGSGLEVIRLDEDLDLWCDLDANRFAECNPVASVLAAGFGVHGGIYGPVVLTGAQDEHGVTTSISVAASVLVAGTAGACDGPRPSAATRARRRGEFAALGIDTVDPDRPAGALAAVPAPRESFDALAHTVTRDGDLPRCPECDEYAPGGHAEHQPEALAEPDDGQ